MKLLYKNKPRHNISEYISPNRIHSQYQLLVSMRQ